MIRSVRNFSALVLTLLLFSGIATAQVSITGVPFLQIEPDSRSAGMGNAGVAIADNAAAMFWNPAGLAFQRGSQISITHANWLPNFNVDLFYDYLVGKTYIDGIGTIAGHITYLNLGEQIRTDAGGNNLGRFNSFEVAVGGAYGLAINKNFAIGFGARVIYSSLATGSVGVGSQEINPGSSVGVDISSLYRTDPFTVMNRKAEFSAGFNLSNMGPPIQYSDNAQRDPLPTVLRFGYAYTMELDQQGYNTITLATDVTKIMARVDEFEVFDPEVDSTVVQTSPVPVFQALVESWKPLERNTGNEDVTLSVLEQFIIGTGFEYWYDKKFALRAGYFYEDENNGNREFITFGAGIRYNLFGIDFSYLYTLEEDHPLSNTIRFSALLNF